MKISITHKLAGYREPPFPWLAMAKFYGDIFALKAMTPNFHVVIDFTGCPLFTMTRELVGVQAAERVELNINHASQNKYVGSGSDIKKAIKFKIKYKNFQRNMIIM